MRPSPTSRAGRGGGAGTRASRSGAETAEAKRDETGRSPVPAPVVTLGRRALGSAAALYQRAATTRRSSARRTCRTTGTYIVAANHASHLDMGLVKYALGEQGRRWWRWRRKDYFFDTGAPDVLRELHEPRPDGARRLAQGEPHGGRRGAPARLPPPHLPRGDAAPRRRAAAVLPDRGLPGAPVQRGRLPAYLSGTFEALPPGGAAAQGRSRGALRPADRGGGAPQPDRGAREGVGVQGGYAGDRGRGPSSKAAQSGSGEGDAKRRSGRGPEPGDATGDRSPDSTPDLDPGRDPTPTPGRE